MSGGEVGAGEAVARARKREMAAKTFIVSRVVERDS